LKKENNGERLKYLLLKLPKENPNAIFNDDYKKEVIELIEKHKKKTKEKHETKE
jgi:hypothetical protein